MKIFHSPREGFLFNPPINANNIKFLKDAVKAAEKELKGEEAPKEEAATVSKKVATKKVSIKKREIS